MGALILAQRAILVALASASLLAAPAEPVGTTIAVRNLATVTTPPQGARRAVVKLPVLAGDLFTTGRDSAVRVQLADATFFSLGANASARIDRFVYDPARGASKVTLSFMRGAFRFASGKPTHAYPGQTAIVTPTATIGIRGTIVTGVIGPEALAYYREADPSLPPDTADAESATLIILSDAGAEGGGADVTGSGVLTELRTAGEAVFFRRPGGPPLPPRMLPPELRGAIEGRAAPPGLGREPRGQQGRQEQGAGNNGPRGGNGTGGNGGSANGGNAPGNPGGGPPGGPGGGPPH